METKSRSHTTGHHIVSRIGMGGRGRDHAGSAHSGKNLPCTRHHWNIQKKGDIKQNVKIIYYAHKDNSNEQTTTYPRQTEDSRGECMQSCTAYGPDNCAHKVNQCVPHVDGSVWHMVMSEKEEQRFVYMVIAPAVMSQ